LNFRKDVLDHLYTRKPGFRERGGSKKDERRWWRGRCGWRRVRGMKRLVSELGNGIWGCGVGRKRICEKGGRGKGGGGDGWSLAIHQIYMTLVL
jgi:hypothetical protein